MNYWEFPLLDSRGCYGPYPTMGQWTADGVLAGHRPMTKAEQINELFVSTQSDVEGFRNWLLETNPAEFQKLEDFCARWIK